MKTVEAHIKLANAQFAANEKFLLDNPDLPLKTLLETYEKQVKLEGLLGWLRNVEAFHNPKKVIPVN